MCISCEYLFFFSYNSMVIFFFDRDCNFTVAAVVAVWANDKTVFSSWSHSHKFMRNLSAHNAIVTLNRNKVFETQTFVYSYISVKNLLIVTFQIFLSDVERICIFHGEFSCTNKPTPWSCFISEFRLDLIYHARQPLMTCYCVHHHVYSSFFMGHSQKHVMIVSVLESDHFIFD